MEIAHALHKTSVAQAVEGVRRQLVEWADGSDPALLSQARIYNPWFIEEFTKEALNGLVQMLEPNAVAEWLGRYKVPVSNPKSVGLVLPGNLPLVGFHDVLCVWASGHKAMVKLSAQDNVLMEALIKVMNEADWLPGQPRLQAVERLNTANAIIATGGDNSTRYFEQYFGNRPHIIRGNRQSVAILTGNETDAELEGLCRDVFLYFGMGCRSVSALLVPANYELAQLYPHISKWQWLYNQNKYANNVDYHRAIFLMNLDPFLEMGPLILRENDSLYSPLGVLNIIRYATDKEVNGWLKVYEAKLQAIVGAGYLAFGSSQNPGLGNYADRIDTMRFLEAL